MKNPSEQLLGKIEVDRLTSLPQVLLKLIEACNSPQVNFDQLASIIRQDTVLSSKIISVANSPLYLQWGKVSDLNRLVVVLGLNTIRTIAITSSVMQFFSQFTPRRHNYIKRFWFKSLYCANAVKALAELTSYELPEEAYLAGLLHRLGQLVFLSNLSDTYLPMLEKAADPFSLAESERKAFSISHGELAAWLIDRWQVDEFISDAVCFQDEPVDSILDAHPLVKLINISSKFCFHINQPSPQVFADADTLFGLSQPVLEDMLAKVHNDVEKSAEAMGIEIDGDPATEAGDSETGAVDEHRLKLAKLVRDVALMDGSAQNFAQATGLEDILNAIQQNISILFGLTDTLFFFLQGNDRLTGHPLKGQSESLARLSVLLEPGRSLVSDSVLQLLTLDSFSDNGLSLNVIDRQIIRLLGTDGFIAVPLTQQQRLLGVMVSGVNENAIKHIRAQQDLIRTFSSEAATNLARSIDESIRQEESRAEEQAHFNLRARKIVHEANNPLGIINNYLHILSTKLGDHPAQNEINIIKEEIERVGKILLRLPETMSNEPAEQHGLIEINQLIRSIADIFKASLFATNGIEAKLDLFKDLPSIRINRDRLKQVLVNLVKNAVEAMSQGGKLSIGTRDGLNMDGQKFIEIRISDNGPGIPPEIMQNLFNPVTSTKGSGHSGLGLTIARNLVNELDGKISCRSNSEGTNFQILLPRRTDS